MIVKVLRAFALFAENQIIETKQYAITETSVTNLINEGAIQIVMDYIEKVDNFDEYITYYGKSYGGALESDSVWTIAKTQTSGTVTTRTVFHDRAWSDRTTL